MSYDINFWKLERPSSLEPVEIYSRLSQGEVVEGLARLPVEEILKKLKEAFADFDPKEEFPLARTSEGSIEFIWTDQYFRFDIRGGICADCQKVVDVMTGFGCPMYDPQVGRRYDAEERMTVGETPRFEEVSPELKEQMKRLKARALASVKGPGEKKGCAGVVVLMLAVFVAVWGVARFVGA